MAHKLSTLGLIGFLDSRIWDIVKESYHPTIPRILVLTINIVCSTMLTTMEKTPNLAINHSLLSGHLHDC